MRVQGWLLVDAETAENAEQAATHRPA